MLNVKLCNKKKEVCVKEAAKQISKDSFLFKKRKNMHSFLTKEKFKKISRMAVIGATTASFLLVSTVPPVFGQVESESSVEDEGVITLEDGPEKSTESGLDSFSTNALAPDCLVTSTQYRKGDWKYIDITNNCGVRKRFKIIISFGRDGKCESLDNGYTQPFRWKRGDFDKLESC
ncbi:MAG: hypothetical protein ACHBN1_00230 [Heteroscytonema crispum UTEX LB 1556]